jgi:hypothetical protein
MKAEWTSWFTADSKVETAAENQIDFETIKSGRILVKRKDSKMIFKVSSDTNVAGYPTLIFCPGTVSWKWCGVGAVDPDFL